MTDWAPKPDPFKFSTFFSEVFHNFGIGQIECWGREKFSNKHNEEKYDEDTVNVL